MQNNSTQLRSLKKINILYTSFDSELSPDLWKKLVETLPPSTQKDISRFKIWKDRHSRLFGKLLLKLALQMVGEGASINTLYKNELGRPFIQGKIDFNISHSGNHIACAVVRDARIGLDIEKFRKIEPENFKRFILKSQLDAISTSQNPSKTFFDCWTTNESVLKGDGRGFSVSLDKMKESEGCMILEKSSWFVQKIFIHSDYSANIATNTPDVQFQVENIPLQSLFTIP